MQGDIRRQFGGGGSDECIRKSHDWRPMKTFRMVVGMMRVVGGVIHEILAGVMPSTLKDIYDGCGGDEAGCRGNHARQPLKDIWDGDDSGW